MKQLLVGPRKYRVGNITGGEVVLFENWISYCDSNGYKYDVIDANKGNYANTPVALFCIYLQLLRKIWFCDVVFLQGSKNDYFFIAPFVALVSKVARKPLFLRKFAGNFDKDYNSAPKWKQLGIRWAMRRANTLFWEVKRLLPFGRQFNDSCVWFPNTRIKPLRQRDDSLQYDRKKFVFISQVRKEKGIDGIIEAFRHLGPDYSIDIYGPLIGYTAEQLGDCYKGLLSPDQVSDVLTNYQVLLLPTVHKEGYPGIIIEAFGAGLPVITTRAGGIPEMVKDGENGVFCASNSADDIIDAIKRFEKMNFIELSKNAARSFDLYDSEKVNKQVFDILNNAIAK